MIAFYTRNEIRAYNMRNRCRLNNLEINYVADFGELFTYLISCKKGIIILDIQYFKHFKLLNAFCSVKNFGQYKFILLKNQDENVDLKDPNIYFYSYDEVEKLMIVLPKYINDLNCAFDNFISATQNSVITNILERFKISPKYTGFNYLKDCIYFGTNNKNDLCHLNKNIYPKIAKNYNTTVDNVEKNIRIAIKNATILHPELFSDGSFCDGKVTNRKFVSHIVEEVELFNLNKLEMLKMI